MLALVTAAELLIDMYTLVPFMMGDSRVWSSGPRWCAIYQACPAAAEDAEDIALLSRRSSMDQVKLLYNNNVFDLRDAKLIRAEPERFSSFSIQF